MIIPPPFFQRRGKSHHFFLSASHPHDELQRQSNPTSPAFGVVVIRVFDLPKQEHSSPNHTTSRLFPKINGLGVGWGGWEGQQVQKLRGCIKVLFSFWTRVVDSRQQTSTVVLPRVAKNMYSATVGKSDSPKSAYVSLQNCLRPPKHKS